MNKKYDITSHEELHKLREELTQEYEALPPEERAGFWARKAAPALRKMKTRRLKPGGRAPKAA